MFWTSSKTAAALVPPTATSFSQLSILTGPAFALNDSKKLLDQRLISRRFPHRVVSEFRRIRQPAPVLSWPHLSHTSPLSLAEHHALRGTCPKVAGLNLLNRASLDTRRNRQPALVLPTALSLLHLSILASVLRTNEH